MGDRASNVVPTGEATKDGPAVGEVGDAVGLVGIRGNGLTYPGPWANDDEVVDP